MFERVLILTCRDFSYSKASPVALLRDESKMDYNTAGILNIMN